MKVPGLLTSKGHCSDTYAGPVFGDDSPSQSYLALDKAESRIPIKQVGMVKLARYPIKEREKEGKKEKITQ